MRAKSVLYAERNPVMRVVVSDTLRRIGHGVTAVATGAEILTAVRGQEAPEQPRFDVVLLGDLETPDIALALRGMGDAFAPLPILALADGDMADERGSGLTAALFRPVDWPRLLRMIAGFPYQARPQEAYPVLEAEPETCILDLTMLLMMKARRPAEQMGRILNVAIDTVEKPVQQMRQAYERQDLESFHRAMHILKGMAGQLGAVMIAALAERFERVSPEELQQAAPLLAELQSLTDDLRRQLIDIRASLDQP